MKLPVLSHMLQPQWDVEMWMITSRKYLLYSKGAGEHRFWWRKSATGGCPQSLNFYGRDQCLVHCPWIIPTARPKTVDEKNLLQDPEYFPLDN